MATHAKRFSPSAAERWMTCPGSVAACLDLPNESSSYADEGTAAHYMAEQILRGADGKSLVGKKADNGVEMTAEMLLEVTKYTNYVLGVVEATGGILMVEQRLPLIDITGEDAHGTSDVVILAGDEIIVVDLKYGMGVKVEAENNPQLQIYALAALGQFGLAQDFTRARVVIHQPRLNHVSEWAQPVSDLESFGVAIKWAVGNAMLPDADLVPSDKGCKFCRAKATCPAIRQQAMDEFEVLTPVPKEATDDQLASAMAKADLIEGWVKSIRAEVERRLLSGIAVPGYKIVQGKRGNRQWSNKEEAEALLKKMRLKIEEMYDFTLISPATADKLAKANVIGPRQWPQVQALFIQSEGRPSVAPESDKRPAMVTSADASDFDDVTLS